MNRNRHTIVVILAVGLLAAGFAAAEDEPGWSDTAELSYVLTAGNSESSTLGFKNTLQRRWETALFTLVAGGVRAESTTTTRTAFGTRSSFDLDEDDVTDTSAEKYFLNGRYDREITERFFWFGGAGWERNRPSGIENRYTAFGGVGNIWKDTDTVKFRTDYAVSWTDEESVVPAPGVDETYAGLRFSWTYWNQLNDATTYGNDFVVNLNLDETDDRRGDMTNWLQVAMSSRLALKVSLQWLYDDQPSLLEVPLFDNPGPTGTLVDTVFVEADDLDTVFTASLVANF